MHSLGIVQWKSTRRDHPGNLGGVSGSGLVIRCPRGISRLHAPEVYSRSILCGGLGTDRG